MGPDLKSASFSESCEAAVEFTTAPVLHQTSVNLTRDNIYNIRTESQ